MTQPTPPEKLVSTLARKWKLDVELPDEATPATLEWVPVRAIQEFTPGGEPTLEDDSDYDSGGWTSSAKTADSWLIEATLLRKIGITSQNYDRGQEGLRTASAVFGAGNTVKVRWYDRDGLPEAYEGYASVGWVEGQGGTTVLSTAVLTLTGQGPRTAIANPVAAP